MSVKFILGRGESGKSTYMLDKIQERVQDNETSPVILLLPEQYTFEMEKRISKLFSGDKKDKYLRARVLSFKTMGNIVFSNVCFSYNEKNLIKTILNEVSLAMDSLER